VTHNAVTVAGYDYLGMSQVTGVHHPEPGVFRRRSVCGWRGASRRSRAGRRPRHMGVGRGGRVGEMPVAHSPYGVPFGLPGPDANGDGLVNGADFSVLLAGQGKSVGDPGYTVLADVNLDGTINGDDLALYANYTGGAMGRGVLSSSVTRNRKGYAGYEHDGVLHMLAHVRHRVYEIERGRWIQRDPLGFASRNAFEITTAYYANHSAAHRTAIAVQLAPQISPCITPDIPIEGLLQPANVCLEWDEDLVYSSNCSTAWSVVGPFMARNGRFYRAYVGITTCMVEDIQFNVQAYMNVYDVAFNANTWVNIGVVANLTKSVFGNFHCDEQGNAHMSDADGGVLQGQLDGMQLELDVRTQKRESGSQATVGIDVYGTIIDHNPLPSRPEAPAIQWLANAAWNAKWICKCTRYGPPPNYPGEQ